jgi:hypothetical protein
MLSLSELSGFIVIVSLAPDQPDQLVSENHREHLAHALNSIDILEDTSSITLNASDLSFALGSIAAIDSSGNLHKAKADIVEDKKQERVTFQFEDPFKRGSSIQLRAAYEAKLGNSMLGECMPILGSM